MTEHNDQKKNTETYSLAARGFAEPPHEPGFGWGYAGGIFPILSRTTGAYLDKMLGGEPKTK
jgi:hypothetical protein